MVPAPSYTLSSAPSVLRDARLWRICPTDSYKERLCQGAVAGRPLILHPHHHTQCLQPPLFGCTRCGFVSSYILCDECLCWGVGKHGMCTGGVWIVSRTRPHSTRCIQPLAFRMDTFLCGVRRQASEKRRMGRRGMRQNDLVAFYTVSSAPGIWDVDIESLTVARHQGSSECRMCCILTEKWNKTKCRMSQRQMRRQKKVQKGKVDC